jgi:hypothetical protein
MRLLPVGLGCNATVHAEFESSPSSAAGNSWRGVCSSSACQIAGLCDDRRPILELRDDALVKAIRT